MTLLNFSFFTLHFSFDSVSEKMTEKTSEKILRYIKENASITIAELARRTGITTRTIERNLRTLQNEEKLVRIGPDKGGSWKVLDFMKEAPHDSR